MRSLRALALLALLAAPLHAVASRDCVNANNDSITLNVDEVFNGSEGSLSIWLAPDSMAEDGSVAVILRAASSNQIQIIWIDATSAIRTEYIANSVIESRTNVAAEDGVFRHIGMTWSAGADEVRHYFQGELVETDTALGAFTGTIAVQLLCDRTAAEWDGRVAHFQLWNRAITTVEMQQAYRCPGSVASGLINWLPLWEDGDTYVDLSATGQDGTNTGTDASSDGPPVSLCGGQQ